jgi:hypothetical protein
MESERARLALVDDPAAAINQVEAVGPGRVRALGGVAEFIEQRGNLDPQLAHARTRELGAFVFAARAGKDHFVFEVALHLPDVARMRLGDVDHLERDSIAILLVELVESGNLPPEGRSGIAAKDEHHGLGLRSQRRELDLAGVVELVECEVGRAIAEVERACAGAQPQGFKRHDDERGGNR